MGQAQDKVTDYMSDLTYQIQAAIFDTLRDAIAGLGVGLYDGAPHEAALPLIDIGETNVSDWSDKTQSGQDIVATLHIYSNYKGQKEVKSIMASIHDILHMADLPIDGGSVASCRFETAEVFVDADPRVRHGVVRYRILVS
jgi:hypothetical protein